MRLCPIVAVLGLALTAIACGPQGGAPRDGGTWVGTITTEGNVTTVINESGSVWGEPVTLVEDLSIGVESGDEPYMFGPIVGVGATDDRIYVADDLLFAVRVYDHDGTHLFDFGREGEGPGEFDDIRKLAVDVHGRVLVHGVGRVNVFDLDGNVLGSWPYRSSGLQPITVTNDGTAFVPTGWTENDERLFGMIAVAADGSERQRLTGPAYDASKWGLVARQGGRTIGSAVLYAPGAVWAVLPSGAIVEGTSDAYRFTVKRPDGSSMIIERTIELPVVPAEYAEWFTIQRTDVMRRLQPDWAWTANPVPEHKPAFSAFTGDRYGRIWVQRALGTERVAECDADPRSVESGRAIACWKDVLGFDVFDEGTGRFLGEIALPHAPRFPAAPIFLENALLMVHEDEAGTIRVKRYRLVTDVVEADGPGLPKEEEQ